MKATLLIQNARIRPLDDRIWEAESIAAIGNRIMAVGRNADLAGLTGPYTQVLDLDGRVVLPGFIDAHEHFSQFSQFPLQLDLSAAKADTIAKILDSVASEAKRVPPGEWIRGRGYDHTKIKDGRLPSKAELDAVSTLHPVILVHVSAHRAIVNSEALRRGRLDVNTPDPVGGKYVRFPETGELTGELVGMAAFNFYSENMSGGKMVVPPFGRDIRKKALIEAARILNKVGITGVHDASVSPSYITSYHDACRENFLTLRVNMLIPYHWLSDLERTGLVGNWGNEWVRSTGVKIVIDGAIAGCTAALKDGYNNNPEDHGLLYIADQMEIDQLVSRAHVMGYQACLHANGDLAVEMALDAIEKAQTDDPRPDPRHRIEHCTMVNDSILKRMCNLGVIATPFASYLWQHSEKLVPFYGIKRAEAMFAHKSFLDRGVKVAGASDHPAGLLSPLLGVQSMVTRRIPSGEVVGRDQKISLQEAFKMYTSYAAYASFEEKIKGSLTPGRLADMVVLSADPWRISPEEISKTSVVMTILGGRVVHREM